MSTKEESPTTEISAKTAEPVQPRERLIFVDVLRGFAVLGILIANMGHFSGQRGLDSSTSFVDRAVLIAIMFFIQAKFYSLFSLLFGWGLAVQLNRAKLKSINIVPVYLRRLVILLCFGVIHAIFIWSGDILLTYALLGFLLILFRNCSRKTLLILVGIFLLFSMVITLPGDLMVSFRAWYENVTSSLRYDTYPLSLYKTGNYPEITKLRVQDYLGGNSWIIYSFGNIFAMFLLGLFVGNQRIFENLTINKRLLVFVCVIGLTIGVLFNAIFVYSTLHQDLGGSYNRFLSKSTRSIGAPALMLFYVSGIILLWQRKSWQKRLYPLNFVGRMALSNYIFQSVFATLIFYGYGLGLYGDVSRIFALGLTVFIFYIQVRLSSAWFEEHDYGPLEWIWRYLTYGHVAKRTSSAEYPTRYSKAKKTTITILKRAYSSPIVFISVWGFLIVWGGILFYWYMDLQPDTNVMVASVTERLNPGQTQKDAIVGDANETSEQDNDVIPPLVLPVTYAPQGPAAVGDMPALAASFDPSQAMLQIEALTSEKYQGRQSGSDAGSDAGEYIAEQFEEFGLIPVGDEGTFFQTFTVTYTPLDAVPSLAVRLPGAAQFTDYQLYQDFSPFVRWYSGWGDITGEAVWADDCGKEDLFGLDLRGTILVCFADTRQDWLLESSRNAMEYGAAGLLFVTDPNTRPADFGYAFKEVWVPEPIPTFRIYPQLAEDIISASGYTFEDLSAQETSFSLESSVHLSLSIAQTGTCPGTNCSAHNVLGVLPGRDPDYAHELVILSAHYDHMGGSPDGTFWPGANDNASGVAVMLEIARSWRENGFVPRRTVMFAAWDAEEIGLLGSYYYVEHPVFPLEDTLMVVNLDMVGVGTEKLAIGGSETLSSHLVTLANEKNITTNLSDSGGSDHAPFIEAGVEAAVLIWEDDGTFIEHYHRPADNVEGIDLEALADVADIANLALLDIVESQPAIKDMLVVRQNAIINKDLDKFLETSSASQDMFDKAWVSDLSELEISRVNLQPGDLSISGNNATANMQITIEHIDANTEPITQVLRARLPVQITYEGQAWKWAGPDLHLVDRIESSDSDLSLSVNVFAEPNNADQLAGIAGQIAQSYQEISDQLGGPAGDLVDVYLLPDSESFRASISLAMPEGQNQWVSNGAFKLIYSDQISSSKILKNSLVKLYLANAGIPSEAAPWLWNGLPPVFDERLQSVEVQKRFIPVLHSKFELGEADDSLASDWAAAHYLLDKIDWAGLGKFISEFGELCKTNRCGDQQALDDLFTTNLGVDQQQFESEWHFYWNNRLSEAQDELDSLMNKRSVAIEENNSTSFMQTVDDDLPHLKVEQANWFADAVQLDSIDYKYRPVAFLPDGDILTKIFIIPEQESNISIYNQTPIAEIVFTLGEQGYKWSGPNFSKTSGEWLKIYTPHAAVEWAAAILPDAERYYLHLNHMLGLEPERGQVLSVYGTPGELEFSVAQSMFTAGKISEWTASGEGIKLVLHSQWDNQHYLGTIAKLFAKNLLFEAGLTDDWLQRGLSIYLTQSFNNQEMKNAASELFIIREGNLYDQFFSFEDFPLDYELSVDERKIADAQSWDAVRYLVNRYGWRNLTQLIEYSHRGYSLDRSLQLALDVPLVDFAEDWRESIGRGHVEPEWGDVVNQFDLRATLEDIGILTAPELSGRLSGTPGAQHVAEYIADVFDDLGLLSVYSAPTGLTNSTLENDFTEQETEPGSGLQHLVGEPPGADTFYQQFPITRTVFTAAPTLSVSDNQLANEVLLPYREGFLIRQIGIGLDQHHQGQLMWAGNHPDLDIDLRDKIVLQVSTQDLAREISWAKERGAAVLIITGNKREADEIYTKQPLIIADAEDNGMVVLELTQMGFTRLLELLGQSRSSIRELDAGTALGYFADLQLFMVAETVPAKNVIAWLPGSDPILKDEFIIIGAHYDHVGDDPGMRYSGANDNASGISVMLELARLWHKAAYHPKRSIVFVAWDAQEYGNWGSIFYHKNPIIPLENTIAVVNLDGVAGGDGFNLGITGDVETDSLLLLATRAAADYLEEKITWVNDVGEGDQEPFHTVGIPSLLLGWRLANEDNLPDEYANGVNPIRLGISGKIVTLAVMALAQ